MVHDQRLIPTEFGGSMPVVPVSHKFGDQRDSDCRHPMLLNRPEGRDTLFRSECRSFNESRSCVYGPWCKFLHVGKKTAATTSMLAVEMEGRTMAEAAAARRRGPRRARSDLPSAVHILTPASASHPLSVATR